LQISELQGKEVVNLHDGGHLGVIEETELIINPEDGSLESLLLPEQRGVFDFFKGDNDLVIPWDSIVKIGPEIIIVDLPLDEEATWE
jgi:YlmC/YmxH family sporulation protein